MQRRERRCSHGCGSSARPGSSWCVCLVDRSFPLPKTDNGSEIAPSKLTGQTAAATSRRDIKRCLPNALCPKTRREAVVCSRFGSFVGTSGIFFGGRRTEADGRERKTIKFVVFKAICGGDQRDRLTHRVTKRRRLAVQSRREERQVKPPAKSPSRPSNNGRTSEPTDARSKANNHSPAQAEGRERRGLNSE